MQLGMRSIILDYIHGQHARMGADRQRLLRRRRCARLRLRRAAHRLRLTVSKRACTEMANGSQGPGAAALGRQGLSDRRPHVRRRRRRRRRRGLARQRRLRPGGPEDRLRQQGVPDPLAHRRGAGRHFRFARQHGAGRLALAHVRHRQGLRLARRPGRDRISVPQRARRGLRARALGRAVLAHRGRQDLSAPVRRHDHRFRQGHRPAHLRRRRPHRPRHAAHALRPGAEGQVRVLHRIFRHRPDQRRRRPRARPRLPEDGRRHDPPLPRPDDDSRHRRLRPRLFLRDQRPHLHRRRQRDGAARRPPAAGHGVRAVPPDRHLRRRLPDHRGRARRRRLSRQFRRRALHGALRAAAPRTSPRATSSAAR